MTTQHPEALHHTKYLTAVYRDINPGDEARELITHPKMTAASWSHVMDERDRLRSENETLQAGYDAARLEIESLQARIKTMAEEHADELMVAHMDGMRAAQPAPQQEAQEPVAWYVTGCGRLLDEDEAKAEARHIGGTARAMPLYTAPQADSVLEDAARWTTEQEHAIRQGHEIAASDSYFEARPQIDSNDRRKVFQAGFERGWDAARKQGENHD